MRPSRSTAWLALLGACGALAWWQSPVPASAPGRPATAVAAPATAQALPAPPVSATRPVYPGGVVPIDPGSLTVADLAALAKHEAAVSADNPPVAMSKGIDGKPRAFRYPTLQQSLADEERRQARRAQLLRELEADPAAFARVHRLSLDEVRWIVDGDTDFPDRLLEP